MADNKKVKILHTADWHLGKKLEHYSRHEEQIEVMNEICQIAEDQQVNLVIVAGDLYDTFNPPAESQDLFYKTLHKLTNKGKRAVIAIAGNHDMPERIEAPHPLAQSCGIIFSGFPNTKIPQFEVEDGLKVLNSKRGFVELKLPDIKFSIRLLLTPYANEMRLKTYLNSADSEEELRNVLQEDWQKHANEFCDNKGVNLMVAHLYFMKKGGEQEEEPEGEKSILHIGGAQAIYSENIPKEIQYAALGHLHRYHAIDKKPCPIVYSSSPLCYSFAEADQKKYVVIVELEPGADAVYNPIELVKGFPLKRKRFENIDSAKQWLRENRNAYVEITLVTDSFLDGDTRKQLTEIHERIVDIVPEIRKKDVEEVEMNPLIIDPTKDISSLFVDYFKYENNAHPSENIMNLFKEVLGKEEEK
jgi:exonuclease SbcD